MIAIQNLSHTFFPGTPNQVHALRAVDLDIPPRCFAAIIGTNGSGKSTLLNALAGTIPILQGTIHIDQTDITRQPEHQRATLIGRVFQNPFAGTVASMSIAENLALAAQRGKPRGLARALSRKTRNEIAERVKTLGMNLENRLDNPIGTLSGGQRQALTLLMATWNRPRLLLLDEHTAALDPKSAAQVARLTHQIIQRDHLTALMVTHSMHQAVALPDTIIMMHKGRIVRRYEGPHKARIRTHDLLADFDKLRRREQLDETAAHLIHTQYR